jgi:ABC-type branched-subunit amino acid transport system substrate-binding protein
MPQRNRSERRKFLKATAAGAVAASVGPFFVTRSWAATPIKIGHVNTFSGPLAALGEQGKWGLTVAVNRINKAGGINGRMLEVLDRDDAFKPAQAVREAEKLILKDGVDVITGVSSSGICVQVAPLVERFETMFVLGTGCETTTLTGDTAEKCPKFVFRPYNSTRSQAIAMAPWAIANGVKSATSLYMDMAWGQSVQADFRDEFVRLGGKWMEPVGAPVATADYLPFVTRLSQEVDGVLWGMSGGPAIKSMLAAADVGLTKKVKLFGPASASDVNTIDQQGQSAVGGFFLHRYPPVKDLAGSPFDDPDNHSFRNEFLALSNGVLPSGFAQAQFTGMNVIADAMRAVKFEDKKQDTPRMIEWLEGGDTEFGPGRMFERGANYPQGDIFLRGTDHQGFVNFYMATVEDDLSFKIVGDIVPLKSTLYESKFDAC